NWTLLLERDSFATLVVSLLVFVFAGIARSILGYYGERKLGIARLHLRSQLWRAGMVLSGQNH
ncbi:MAG: hypothetical protein ACRD5L_00815, partial [Bryobacteraceae bacterium]